MCVLIGGDPFKVRLRGGTVPWEGYLEVRLNNVWGRICQTGWGSVDSGVLCRELGYAGGLLRQCDLANSIISYL